MAAVYRATDLSTGRDVALKVPFSDGEGGTDTIRRLLREVRLTVRLVHPNIVAVLGAFDHAGAPWLVMELVEGPTLGETIDERGAFSAEDVSRHGEGLASALGLAHARRVLHRDVSPGNILMAAGGRAKLTDFGLATVSSAPHRGDAGTHGGALEAARGPLVGTPGYISPETILGACPDPRSDLFSLGAVLYEMCTGRPAFPGSTREEIFKATLENDPAAITPSPPGLDAIVRRALAKEPEGRYRDAEEMETELRDLRIRIGA